MATITDIATEFDITTTEVRAFADTDTRDEIADLGDNATLPAEVADLLRDALNAGTE